jgi:hypothetical protein
MEIHIDLYNSLTAVAWAVVVFLIAGIAMSRGRK